MGIAPRVELNAAEGFEPYLEMGVKHFNVGIDVRTLLNFYRDAGAILRKELGVESLVDTGESLTPAYGH